MKMILRPWGAKLFLLENNYALFFCEEMYKPKTHFSFLCVYAEELHWWMLEEGQIIFSMLSDKLSGQSDIVV